MKEGAKVMKHEHYMDMNRLSDWSVDQINELLDVCLLMKEMEEKGVRLPLLKNISLAMMFDQQSTRTRVSFAVMLCSSMAAPCMPDPVKRILLRRRRLSLLWPMPS